MDIGASDSCFITHEALCKVHYNLLSHCTAPHHPFGSEHLSPFHRWGNKFREVKHLNFVQWAFFFFLMSYSLPNKFIFILNFLCPWFLQWAFFFFGLEACGILVPQLEISLSLNHETTREVFVQWVLTIETVFLIYHLTRSWATPNKTSGPKFLPRNPNRWACPIWSNSGSSRKKKWEAY